MNNVTNLPDEEIDLDNDAPTSPSENNPQRQFPGDDSNIGDMPNTPDQDGTIPRAAQKPAQRSHERVGITNNDDSDPTGQSSQDAQRSNGDSNIGNNTVYSEDDDTTNQQDSTPSELLEDQVPPSGGI